VNGRLETARLDLWSITLEVNLGSGMMDLRSSGML